MTNFKTATTLKTSTLTKRRAGASCMAPAVFIVHSARRGKDLNLERRRNPCPAYP